MLVLVDQHAASERVRVESFLKTLCHNFLNFESNGSQSAGRVEQDLEPPRAILLSRREASMLRGSQEVVEYVEKKLGIKTGTSTPDGRIYLKREEECLAACCGAPMMMVDHVYHENLTPQSIDKILDELT